MAYFCYRELITDAIVIQSYIAYLLEIAIIYPNNIINGLYNTIRIEWTNKLCNNEIHCAIES